MKNCTLKVKNSKTLTAALIAEDSSYFFNEDSVTSPANDFLEVKTEIISKTENHRIVLLYIVRLELDDWCLQY